MNVSELIKWATKEENDIKNRVIKYDPRRISNIECYFRMIREQGTEIIQLEKDIKKRYKNICDAIEYFNKHEVSIPVNVSKTEEPKNANTANSAK